MPFIYQTLKKSQPSELTLPLKKRLALFEEYSYEDDIRAQRQEAFEEGAETKASENARNLLKLGVASETVAKDWLTHSTNCSH